MTSDVKRYSYRDPDGYVISLEDKFYRIVYNTYREDLALIDANDLLNRISLIKHTLLDKSEWPQPISNWIKKNENEADILVIFETEKIDCITYPWEWSVSMLRDAALLTLNIQSLLLPIGLSLKDASFYNIQFTNGQPVFIDLLSIKKPTTFYPWHAYGQFLKHFIFPLTLSKYSNCNLLPMLQSFPDGIESPVISGLIPARSWFNIFEVINIHLLNKLSNRKTTLSTNTIPTGKSLTKVKQLIDFNNSYLTGLTSKKITLAKSHWSKYYSQQVTVDYQYEKIQVISAMLLKLPQQLESCVDLGANTGAYSLLLSSYTKKLISVEQDMVCCEIIRDLILKSAQPNLSWNVITADLLAPGASIGWMNKERSALLKRLRSQLVLCLALVHHLYFKGSIYFDEIANLLSDLSAEFVIMEFIHPADEKVKILSAQNNTRLKQYTLENFTTFLHRYFSEISSTDITATRTLFLLKKL